MQPNFWLSARLAESRTEEALQAATGRRLVREAVRRRVPRRAVSRKVGATLIAVGRRLSGPELVPPGVGLPALHQAPPA